MSSSDPNSKIDFLDKPADVRKKIKGAFCEEGNITENGLLAFVKAVLIPISKLWIEMRASGEVAADSELQKPFVLNGAPPGTVFSISRPEKWGGPMHYSSYEDMEQDFAEKKLHPGDLKPGVADAIIRLLEPIQKAYESDPEFQRVNLDAYPPEKLATKEVKKKKVSLRIYPMIRAPRDMASQEKGQKPQVESTKGTKEGTLSGLPVLPSAEGANAVQEIAEDLDRKTLLE